MPDSGTGCTPTGTMWNRHGTLFTIAKSPRHAVHHRELVPTRARGAGEARKSRPRVDKIEHDGCSWTEVVPADCEAFERRSKLLDASVLEAIAESHRKSEKEAPPKFSSSIWGIGCSIIFNVLEKLIEGAALSSIRRVQTRIDGLFSRYTPETA